MATATNSKKKTNSRETFQKTFSDLNSTLINTSENLIEGSVKTGEQYQKLFAKTLKKGEPIVAKQMDLMFDTIEGIRDQFQYGSDRFRKLVGWNNKTVENWRKDAKKTVKTLRKKAADRIEDLQEDMNIFNKVEAKTVRKSTPKAIVKKTIAKVAPKSASKKATAKSAAKKTATKTPAKVVAKKTTAKAPAKVVAKVTTKKTQTNLKLIDGVGPKMEIILKESGIKSLEALAKTTRVQLEKFIETAGPRYRMIDSSTWVSQAKDLIK